MRRTWERTVERFARFGYICKGVVYVIIGLLAAATIIGRGAAADRQTAFHFILEKPFGRLLLFVIAIGLIGYAVWRICSGIFDSERRGADPKGIALRLGSVTRGVFYGWIAIEVVMQVLRHRGGGRGSDTQARHWTARMMDEPFGRAIVIIAGLCVIGYCAWQFFIAVTGKLSKQIHTRSISPPLLIISRLGLGARAIIFGIVGGSLIKAAIDYRPAEARGTSGAMRTLAGQPYGGVWLMLIGAGFAAYGVYAFVNARYREIEAT